MSKLNLKPQTKPWTDLHGIYGSFRSPNRSVTLHFFQTIANNRKKDDSSNHTLLKELKPLRERIEISEIIDLNDILQRDVNDRRVANKIIPYLLEEFEVKYPTFFPSIVVVLIPSDAFNSSNSVYPTPISSKTDLDKLVYGNNWSIQRERIDGELINIGTLSINFNSTVPLVIDGQHRTAAFRVISKDFSFESDKNYIYRHFYDRCFKNLPEQFDSDLPVTIIWFDSVDDSQSIDVREYSRKLFVDINQSSQNISLSRLVLLDDPEPSSFLTRCFYSYLARERGFAPNSGIGLVQSGFDFPYDLSSRKPWSSITLFMPELVSYAFYWMFFGSHSANGLTQWKAYKDSKENLNAFDAYFGRDSNAKFLTTRVSIDGDSKLIIDEQEQGKNKELLQVAFEEKIAGILLQYIELNQFYKRVSSAISQIDEEAAEWKGEWKNQSYQDAWTRLFKGGEGLYYVFKEDNHSDSKAFKEAVNEIDKIVQGKFKDQSKLSEKETSIILSTMRSEAFFVGYMMVFDFVYNLETTLESTIERLNKGLTSIDWDDLALVILESKKTGGITSTIDPKSWPVYRNIFIRYLHEQTPIYSSETSRETLESQMFRFYLNEVSFKQLSRKYPTHSLRDIKRNPSQCLSAADFKQALKDAQNHVSIVFKKSSKLNLIKDYDQTF